MMIEGALISLLIASIVRMGLFYYFSQNKIYLPYKFGYLYSAISGAILATWLGQVSL
jgi:hypothetical protein